MNFVRALLGYSWVDLGSQQHEFFTINFDLCRAICDALLDLVPFVPFKKREKYPWRSVNFSKVGGEVDQNKR